MRGAFLVTGIMASGKSTVAQRLAERLPRAAVVAERERARAKTGYGGGWTPAALDRVLRHETPRLGLWLDTSGQTPDETVAEIITKVDQAVIVKS
ncbi:AAA family ATPase [Actinomadura sp. ATCC 31491]|uniref:AAA family ATPase n=1 Tax=Actinomadura luzonensis TaxID=2805427 RepID=A0ABT0FQB4_9ACTN|nr:AAA family ATPase [Actinomadura luzonensis]MCK2214527.1 AAA family ATPase [Actinomadura luzonensis]